MIRATFQRLLDAHGPDPARWLARRRRAAERLLARSAAARAALREAAVLAALLDEAAEPRRVPEVTEIVARATSHPQDPSLGAVTARRAPGPRAGGWPSAFPLPFGWVPAGALAACLVLGLALGAALPPAASAGAASTTSDILGLASDGPDFALGSGPAAGPPLGEEP